jgi:hypothetical protein
MHKWLSLLVLLNLTAIPAAAQTAAPVRDPNAVALASRALQAMTGGTVIQDITIQASASYTAGSDQEIGQATLVALGNLQSRVTLNLTNGQRQELRSAIRGAWVGPDGIAHSTAAHNCFLDADWFFPVLSLAALGNDPTLFAILVGQEVRGEEPVYHLTLFRYLPGQPSDAEALIQRASLMDLYLDARSLAPSVLAFNVHPDQDANLNLPMEIRFGAYQPFNGVLVPTHIQKYLQNCLFLDLAVTNVAVNSGASPRLFAIPSVPEGGVQ